MDQFFEVLDRGVEFVGVSAFQLVLLAGTWALVALALLWMRRIWRAA